MVNADKDLLYETVLLSLAILTYLISLLEHSLSFSSKGRYKYCLTSFAYLLILRVPFGEISTVPLPVPPCYIVFMQSNFHRGSGISYFFNFQMP